MVNKLKTSIIPEKQIFSSNNGEDSINFKAICIFAATGFFLGKDTYYNNLEVLQPATKYEFDENNIVKSSEVYWKWNYEPKEISLNQATEEFAQIFERICSEKLNGKKVILPLSGGLDSRTQSVALPDKSNIESYSYKFEGSFDETFYGREISKVKSFSFSEFTIPPGYLWKIINKLAGINNCYADFTSPRQMAVIDEISELGDTFYLGHWGDVLFDDMEVEDNISFDEIKKNVKKKILKKGGLELAESLWEGWGLEGTFINYLEERITILLEGIKIENANSRIRAFKSMYWAPRWTSVSMEVFSSYKPVVLPYYDDEMCKFVCRIPEKLLSGREIQINYIKMKNPEIAKIPWQDYAPMNLFDYKKFSNKSRFPLRALKKGKRIFEENILGKKLTLRNWEIQFKGNENEKQLKNFLFNSKQFSEFISPDIVKDFYNRFKQQDEVKYSHSINMLLVLAVFSSKGLNKNN